MSIEERTLERLLADPRLVELCELQRTGDEMLDVISLTENQHSDILAWLLDSREGHGQGDAILRDFLIWGSAVCAGGESGLDGRGSTARFFREWPPSRIRTTSFGSAFVARELGMRASERADLFIIDPQNKFIVLIENKLLSVHSEQQLREYRDSFDDLVGQNPHLRQYQHVYVALDRKFDGLEAGDRPLADSWLHLNYDWLKTSAKRAHMHVSRGNAAAKAVVSYCNRQTDWENPDDERSLSLAVDLHQDYSNAIRELLTGSRGRLEKLWLRSARGEESTLLFLLQNKSLVKLLKETQGMATIKSAIVSNVADLPAENVRHTRVWLDMCPVGWEQYEGPLWWPVYLNVQYADDAQTKYKLSLCWDSHKARSEAEAERLRLTLQNIEPAFEKFPGKWRRVVVGRELSQGDLLKQLSRYNGSLRDVLTG